MSQLVSQHEAGEGTVFVRRGKTPLATCPQDGVEHQICISDIAPGIQDTIEAEKL